MKTHSAGLHNLLLVGAICSQIWAYIATYLYKMQGVVSLDGVFYQFNALTHLILWVILFGIIFLDSNKWTARLIVTGFILAFNQFSDEMWFDPYEIGTNERVLGGLLIVYYFVEIIRSNVRIEYLNKTLD